MSQVESTYVKKEGAGGKIAAWFTFTSTAILLIITIALIIRNWNALPVVGFAILLLLFGCAALGVIYGIIRVILDLRARHQTLRIEREKHEAELARTTHEMEIQRREFALKQHLLLTRVGADERGNPPYLLNLPAGTRITALPSYNAASRQQQAQLPAASPSPELPGHYDLLQVYKNHDITPDSLFLGKGAGDEYFFINANDLCHGAFSAMTGGGKTIVERGIISQLLCIGHKVILADLKFALVTESGLDYRPLAKKMLSQEQLMIDGSRALPCLLRREDEIARLLHWLAYDEMERRIDMRVNGNFSYETLDVFLEELIALISSHPEAVADITRIIALGRELRLNLFTAAQNFLVKDTRLSGGARENFQTAYFLGGDDYSGALLLDMQKKALTDFLRERNIVLGKGIGMLRNNVRVPQATLVRLGFASNESVYYLHGRADNFTLLPEQTGRHTPFTLVRPDQPAPATEKLENMKLARARELWSQGHTSDRKLMAAMDITLYEANKIAGILRAEERVMVNE